MPCIGLNLLGPAYLVICCESVRPIIFYSVAHQKMKVKVLDQLFLILLHTKASDTGRQCTSQIRLCCHPPLDKDLNRTHLNFYFQQTC